MWPESILAHLAPRLTNQIENVATDASAHLLVTYPFTGRVLEQLLAQTGLRLPSGLKFRTQAAADDLAVPDLVAEDPSGAQVLVVESKFWADLTPRQPAEYLQRLPRGLPAVLLFLAPLSRLESLWPVLRQRCTDRGFELGTDTKLEDGFVFAHLNSDHAMAIAAWELVLKEFYRAADLEGNRWALGDIWQLASLCEATDRKAFHPLSVSEMNSPSAERIAQLKGLVFEAVDCFEASALATTQGYGVHHGPDCYRRYFALGELGNCSLEYNESLQREHPTLCLWLFLPGMARDPRLPTPLPLGWRRERGYLRVPLELKLGAEHEQLLADAAEQCRSVAQAVGLLPAGSPQLSMRPTRSRL